jgi:prephenate dehydrogenase
MTNLPNITVAIIGGQGQMGQWFKRFLEGRGVTVLIADLDTSETPQDAAGQADVVMLSVPIPKVAQVAREVAPFLRADAALMDLTSVKQGPMQAMLTAFGGEVVGTHPLFGPGEEGIAGRTVVLCPGRGERWLGWLKELLTQSGAQVKITTPEEHDRLMAIVQGVSHFMLIALGMAIRRLGLDPAYLDDFATPTFQNLYHLTRHLLSQDAALYACIQLQNQANLGVLSVFEEAVAQILSLIQNRDADGLVGLLEENQKYFGVSRR